MYLQGGLGCNGVSSAGLGYLAWYQGDGGTSWTAHNITTSFPRGGCALQVTDFDQDGILDILAGGRDDGTFYYFNNNDGSGLSFASQTVGAGIPQIQNVHAFDVNQDGMMDVVGGGWLNGNVMWCVRFCVTVIFKLTLPCD